MVREVGDHVSLALPAGAEANSQQEVVVEEVGDLRLAERAEAALPVAGANLLVVSPLRRPQQQLELRQVVGLHREVHLKLSSLPFYHQARP